MTTRRRRAGSDSSQFDNNEQQEEYDQATEQTQLINPLLQAPGLNTLTQVRGLPGLSWGASNGSTATPQEAYYKKTDGGPSSGAHHSAATPRIFTPSPISNNHLNNSSTAQYSYPNNTAQQNHSSVGSSVSSNLYNIGEGITNYLTSNFNSGSSSTANNNQYNSKSSFDYCGEGDTADSYSSELDTGAMACRDRSSEFAGIIRSQQRGHLSNGAAGARGTPPSKAGRDLTQYSQFMKRSRLVGQNISSTYAKLEKLTLLARKRSLFDDSQDAEVQELTAIIRHDLGSLTKQLEDLRRCSAPSNTNNTAHMQKHSANLVGSLQTKVATITQKFRDVLEVRTENLKKQAERREQFTGSSASTPLLGGARTGLGQAPPPHTASVLLADEAKAAAASRRGAGRGDVLIDFDGVSSPSSSSSGNSGGAYQQQLQLMEENDSLLQARAETMKTIESTIVELGTMFTQLASMVKEQDELVHRIDANVDDAEMNVEAAHSELLKYFRSVSSNRYLMLKVFGTVIFFFIIFIVFMA